MKKKKAQAEDIFADFVIALIFIITTIILISCTESGEEAKLPSQVIKETAGLYTTDIITMLKSDLRSYGYREMSFAELFAIIAEGKEEQYPWIFGEGALVYDKQCTETLELMINNKLKFGWDMRMYNEQGRVLFRCSPGWRKQISEEVVVGTQISLWLPLHEEGSVRLGMAVSP